MSFQTGLSGLNAASRNLDVIGNNIANANTVGAKVARAEFSEIVAASTIAATGKTEGIGVEVSTVSQQFTQGSVNVTGGTLDLAINGAGFFPITQTDGTPAYTRAGEFKLDKVGNIVTNTGANLMGFVNALLLAAVAQAFGWTLAIAIGAGFAVAGAVLILFVRADCQVAQAA